MARSRRGGIHLRIQVRGVEDVIRRAGLKRARLVREIDMDVEVTTFEAVNMARNGAPVLTGKLQEGIQILPQYTKVLSRTWGGLAEYTRRQEYEHKSKKGFMRRAQWQARSVLRERVRRTIERLGGRL